MSHSKERRAKMAEAMRATWQDPAYRESRAETQQILSEMWNDPQVQQRMKEEGPAFVPGELKRRRKARRQATLEDLRCRVAALEAKLRQHLKTTEAEDGPGF